MNDPNDLKAYSDQSENLFDKHLWIHCINIYWSDANFVLGDEGTMMQLSAGELMRSIVGVFKEGTHWRSRRNFLD